MKSIILFIGIFFYFYNLSLGQTAIRQKDVPERVVNSFNQKFPNTPVDSWLSDDGKFKAVCKPEGQKTTVIFTADGNFLSTRLKMKKSKVPIIVVAGLKSSEHHDWKVLHVEYVETSSGLDYYEFTVTKNHKTEFLPFDKEGNPVTTR